jgi:hypothetical protein
VKGERETYVPNTESAKMSRITQDRSDRDFMGLVHRNI